MGRFKIIIYIFISVGVFAVVNLLMTPKYVEENLDGRIVEEFYREKLANDVLFVGSSTVHAGISPTVLWETYGITSFDRSTASQTAAISYFMVKDAIRVNKPKLVVMDVGFLMNEDDYYEEPSVRKALDGMQLSKVKLDAINACEPVVDYKKLCEYIFPVFRFHARWNDFRKEDFKYLFKKPDVTFNGQLLELEGRQFKDEDFYDGANDPGFIGEGNLQYLQMLSELCKDNGIAFLLIKMPRINQPFTAYADSQLMDFAEKNNIIYEDFQSEAKNINALGISYVDTQHLNSSGAERFSIMLGKFIVSNYDVQNRSGEPEFIQVWGEKSKRYREAIGY